MNHIITTISSGIRRLLGRSQTDGPVTQTRTGLIADTSALTAIIFWIAVILTPLATVADAAAEENWRIIQTEYDPFDPGDVETRAIVAAEPNREIRNYFVLAVNCSNTNPDELSVFFMSGYTNFTDDEYSTGSWKYAPVDVKIGDSESRTIQVSFDYGNDTAWFVRDKDANWILRSLPAASQMFVRWRQYGSGRVVASFDVSGAAAAIQEVREKCAEPLSLKRR